MDVVLCQDNSGSGDDCRGRIYWLHYLSIQAEEVILEVLKKVDKLAICELYKQGRDVYKSILSVSSMRLARRN